MSSEGNVIKKSQAAAAAVSAGPVVKRAVVEARAEARRLLAEAEAEALRVREESEGEARTLRERAYAEGREEALSELTELILEARERRDAALAEAERDLLRLAVKLAEKIVGREVERDPAALADIVANALRQARQNETFTVRVSPADLPLVEAFRAQASEGMSPQQQTQMAALLGHMRDNLDKLDAATGATPAKTAQG